jgi:hypothetical protein
MPKIVERLVRQLKAKGKDDRSARAIAVSSLQRNGVLKAGSTELTPKGKTRDSMTAAERAKDRYAKVAGRDPADYTYNQMKNTARLRKK